MRTAWSPIPVRSAATALLIAAGSLLLAQPAAATCDGAVQAGAIVYTDAYDQIDRFDLAAGLPLPSIPAPGYAPYFDAFAAQDDTLWLAFTSSRWLVHVDATGVELGRIRIVPEVKAVAADADHVFALAAVCCSTAGGRRRRSPTTRTAASGRASSSSRKGSSRSSRSTPSPPMARASSAAATCSMRRRCAFSRGSRERRSSSEIAS